MTGMDFPSSPTNGQQTTDGRYYFDSSVGSAGGWRSTPLPVGGLPAGSIMAWGTNTPPANWLIADGAAVSRSVYSSLFAVIGTTYGTGDGSTTFNLPNLKGRVPVGKDSGTFGTLAGTGGAETHAHGNGSLTAGGTFFPAGGGMYFDYGTKSTDAYLETSRAYWPSNGSTSALSPEGSSSGITVVGSTSSASSLPPYLVLNYIIKASAGWTAGDSELATRVGAVETANNTTNRAGLVPVQTTSYTYSGGSVTANAGVFTLSAIQSISFTSVLVGTYKAYEIVVTGGNSSNVDLLFKFRNGSSDISSGYNGSMIYSTYSGASGVASNNNTSSGRVSNNFYIGNNLAVMEIPTGGAYQVALTRGFSVQASASYYGGFNCSTSADGITIYPATGTFTGTIAIYGLR